MEEILSDEEIAHPLNEKLLGEAEQIKLERRTLKERLAKLDETKDSVSVSVYQKVRNDYASKLDKTTNRLIALKRDLEAEERVLLEKKMGVEANIGSHREKMEESSLRHTLGEYTSTQHQEITAREKQEIERLDSALKTLNEGLQRHREIFQGEDLPEAVKEPSFRPAEPRAMPAPSPAKPMPEPTPPPTSAPALPPQSAAARRPEPPPPSSIESTAKIRLDTVRPEAESTGATERSQVAPRRTSELVVLENGKIVQTVPLDHTVVIGRSPASDIVLKEPKVSRKHAEIQFVGGRYVLLDLESSNGTFIAGKRVSEQVLQPNDEITIGNTKMIFKG